MGCGSSDAGSGRIPLLVSACLLGERVRYDGLDKGDAALLDALQPWFRPIGVCPEVGAGLPVPREAMRLEGDVRQPRLVAIRSRRDLTGPLLEFARRFLDDAVPAGLCGYVCKARSPSSGMAGVPVFDASGTPVGTGAGLFTRAFRDRFPRVPVEESEGLRDPDRRDAFFERVFCRKRWTDFTGEPRDRKDLVGFHTDHKLLLLAHGRVAYTALGRLVADAGVRPIEEAVRQYGDGFLDAVSQPVTRGRTHDVLLHALGYFREALPQGGKADVLEHLERYREGEVPRLELLLRFRDLADRHGVSYLQRQVLLQPHPVESRMARSG